MNIHDKSVNDASDLTLPKERLFQSNSLQGHDYSSNSSSESQQIVAELSEHLKSKSEQPPVTLENKTITKAANSSKFKKIFAKIFAAIRRIFRKKKKTTASEEANPQSLKRTQTEENSPSDTQKHEAKSHSEQEKPSLNEKAPLKSAMKQPSSQKVKSNKTVEFQGKVEVKVTFGGSESTTFDIPANFSDRFKGQAEVKSIGMSERKPSDHSVKKSMDEIYKQQNASETLQTRKVDFKQLSEYTVVSYDQLHAAFISAMQVKAEEYLPRELNIKYDEEINYVADELSRLMQKTPNAEIKTIEQLKSALKTEYKAHNKHKTVNIQEKKVTKMHIGTNLIKGFDNMINKIFKDKQVQAVFKNFGLE